MTTETVTQPRKRPKRKRPTARAGRPLPGLAARFTLPPQPAPEPADVHSRPTVRP